MWDCMSDDRDKNEQRGRRYRVIATVNINYVSTSSSAQSTNEHLSYIILAPSGSRRGPMRMRLTFKSTNEKHSYSPSSSLLKTLKVSL
jgi:hypothetical protein